MQMAALAMLFPATMNSWQPVATSWAEPATSVLEQLDVVPSQGLSQVESERRSKQVGANALEASEPLSRLKILAAQFRGVLVALLAIASVLSLVMGDWPEAIAIASVLAINAIIGYVTELRALRSLEALRNLQSTHIVVRRDGHQKQIEAKSLVPGDIVVLEAGDRVSADLRVIDASLLQADESSLTGESVPVEKNDEPVASEAYMGDRSCLLHSGTTITNGSCEAVVVATGSQAEIGKIAKLVASQDNKDTTPLEKRLDALARTLLWVTLLLASLLALLGILSGKDPVLIIETAIALTIAAVPEGLPIVATMILGRGAHRMAKRQALVQRLSAVETLGATGLICTDKTGTLTENRMRVDQIWNLAGAQSMSEPVAREALKLGALCNHAELSKTEADNTGDPLEVALLVAADAQGLLCDRESVREIAFDPRTRMMATVHQEGAEFLVAVKGAPEAVLELSTPSSEQKDWLARAEEMAASGLRVLAFASKRMPSAGDDVYSDLQIIALIGLVDPPRAGVSQAIASCLEAGIEVCMMTGDHPETARQIASRVGIVPKEPSAQVLTGAQLEDLDWHASDVAERIASTRIFARVSPEQKYELVQFYQGRGTIVAMTGDGVNDAPALRKADIGIAMGLRGTEVAREAADMVLLDDAFETLVAAVQEGRGIFQNIRSFVVYLLSCNLSEILIVGLVTAGQAPLPLLPLQILFLNLVTDVFPALALGATETDPAVMQQRPRKRDQPIVGRAEWQHIVGYGLVITASVIFAFYAAHNLFHMTPIGSVTMAFTTLAFAQLWHVFNMRSPGTLRSPVAHNPFVWGAVALCTALIGLVVYWPPAATLLKLEALTPTMALFVLAMSGVPLLAGTVWRKVRG